MGVPQVDQSAGPRSRGDKRGKTVVLTSSPYLKEVQEERGTDEKRSKPAAKTKLSYGKKCVGKGQSKGNTKGKGIAEKKRKQQMAEDVNGIFCSGLYSESRSGEEWIKCDSCHKWAHDECTGSQGGDANYTCESCLE